MPPKKSVAAPKARGKAAPQPKGKPAAKRTGLAVQAGAKAAAKPAPRAIASSSSASATHPVPVMQTEHVQQFKVCCSCTPKVASHVFSLLPSVEGTTVCLEIPLQSPPPPGRPSLGDRLPPPPGRPSRATPGLCKGGGGYRMVGGKTSFLPHVCTHIMLGIPWGIEMCMSNMKHFSDPSHPAPQTWLLGLDPPGSKTPHMCNQND